MLAAAALLSGCGESSQQPRSSAADSTAAAISKVAAASRLAGRDTVGRSGTVQRPLRGTGGTEINDDNPSNADTGTRGDTQLDPCTLVSKEQVERAVGGQVSGPQEAPLGPTCIFQPHGAAVAITIDVESIDFAKLRPQIRHITQVTVAGQKAICGEYGHPTTFVPLAHERVLSISARCRVGIRLAEEALPHMTL